MHDSDAQELPLLSGRMKNFPTLQHWSSFAYRTDSKRIVARCLDATHRYVRLDMSWKIELGGRPIIRCFLL